MACEDQEVMTKQLMMCLAMFLSIFQTTFAQDFSVSMKEIELLEGQSVTLTASAVGAQKVYWIIKRGNTETVVAVDKYSYTLDAGRVVADTSRYGFVLQFKAVYANEVKIWDIPVTIKEDIPEPVFYLRAPASWNGRETIEVEPEISNLEAMQAKGAGELQYHWTVSGGDVIKKIEPDKLILKRSQYSGMITVKLVLNNGGADFAAKTTIMVTDPKKDAWVERVAARILFEPTIESLKQYETPEWYKDAKLGIYMHWGPQSIPGVDATWYARRMYQPSTNGYKYHVATYGHPSKFGYKDICKLFTAPKFNQAQADRLVELYKKVGARYVVPVAVHHDNFDMWDSKYQPRWNSVVTSGKDVVGMWKKAADKHGLHLGVASHNARSYRWFQPSHGADSSGPMAGVPYDGQNPEYADLYGVKWNDSSFWYEQLSDVGPAEFEKNFEDRMKDLIDKYHPDLYYTDGGIPFHQVGLNILAHLYNESQEWNDGKLQAVATIKLDWTPNIAINNYEYGIPSTVQHYPWQTDKTMGVDWYWERDATSRYKSADWAIRTLLDAVSRNGNLLLNVPLTGDGELEPETVAMLTKMGQCLEIIGEAVFSTRGWVVADDGPGDIRFTRNKANTILYVTILGWPGPVVRIKTLNKYSFDLKNLKSISLVGTLDKLIYRQNAEALEITLPAKAPYAGSAYSIKMTFSGIIPKLNLNIS